MSFAPLRSSTPGVRPSAVSMHEGQLFINTSDQTLFTKSGGSVIPVAGRELFTTQSSGNDLITTLPNGLKIAYGSVDLTYVTSAIVSATVTYPSAFSFVPSVTMAVNSDAVANAPANPPRSFSTRLDPSTTNCVLIAYALEGDPLPTNYTIRAYYQAIGF